MTSLGVFVDSQECGGVFCAIRRKTNGPVLFYLSRQNGSQSPIIQNSVSDPENLLKIISSGISQEAKKAEDLEKKIEEPKVAEENTHFIDVSLTVESFKMIYRKICEKKVYSEIVPGREIFSIVCQVLLLKRANRLLIVKCEPELLYPIFRPYFGHFLGDF